MAVRKLFGTDGVRGKANQYPMTAEIALKLGIAAGALFKKDEHRGRNGTCRHIHDDARVRSDLRRVQIHSRPRRT